MRCFTVAPNKSRGTNFSIKQQNPRTAIVFASSRPVFTQKTTRNSTSVYANPFSTSYGGRIDKLTSLPDTSQTIQTSYSEPSTSGRKIVFAVDGTLEAEEALRWVVQQLAHKGTLKRRVHIVVVTIAYYTLLTRSKYLKTHYIDVVIYLQVILYI